jgi:hypothetical protein
VEQLWRTIKKQYRENGRKRDYDGCVKTLRERLGLKLGEGRQAYFGDAVVEVLGETPDFALIQVEDIGAVESPDLRKLLFASKGILTVSYEHLTHEPGDGDLFEQQPGMTGGPAMPPATTTGTQPSGGTQPVPSAITPSQPAVGAKPDPLDGIVNCRGRKAVIVSRNNQLVRVRFLDTKEEAQVNMSELKPDTQASTESLARIWRSLDPNLTENVRRKLFAAILKLEHSIAYLPPKLQEDLENMAPAGQAPAINQPAQPTFDRPQVPSEDDPQQSDKEDSKFEFEKSDWDVIFKDRNKDRGQEAQADERDPMPEPPKPPKPGAETRSGVASKGIPPAGEAEVNDMVKRIRTARESYEESRGKFSDRPKLHSRISEALKVAEGGVPAAPQTTYEKNLKRAKSWEKILGE